MRVLFLAVSIFLLCLSTPALSEDTQPFTPDFSVQEAAEGYAKDAIDFAAKQFNIALDYSDASIPNVELALSKMHLSFISTKPRPTEEQVMSFAQAFGSYIGEVYRRNHGGEWGIVSIDGHKFPGLRTKSGSDFWPWGRALNRIVEGAGNNVIDYYRVLLEK